MVSDRSQVVMMMSQKVGTLATSSPSSEPQTKAATDICSPFKGSQLWTAELLFFGVSQWTKNYQHKHFTHGETSKKSLNLRIFVIFNQNTLLTSKNSNVYITPTRGGKLRF